MLGLFPEKKRGEFPPPLLDLYERLLEENDNDIWAWLTGKPAPAEYAPLLKLLNETKSETSLRGGNTDEAIQ